MLDAAYRLETDDAPLLHHDLTLADLAHTLHLDEQGLIPREIARTLLMLLLDLDQDPRFHYDPAVGDAFVNRRHWLSLHHPRAAGHYSAGRARREATTVAFRLLVRRRLVELTEALLEMQEALLDLAACHIDTLMPDYTYLQQAHPTTFAHYLLGFVYPLRRDFVRLRDCFAAIDQSPAGIGSINGTRLPISRERLAALLGFDGVIEHTRDAMWQVDAPAEITGAAATLILHLDRLAEDLQVFASTEFGLVALSEEFSRTSAIMPQKQNPYPLAFLRGLAGSLLGRVVETYAIARTPSAQVDNRIFAHGSVPRALELATRGVRLMAGIIRTCRVRTERMREWLDAGFTQATDIAEALSQACDLNPAAAHEIVASAVRRTLARKGAARDLTPAILDEAARETIGRPVHFPEEKLVTVLDPVAIIATRVGTGGAAPERVQDMLADCRADVAAQRTWVEKTGTRIDKAERALLQAAHARGKQ